MKKDLIAGMKIKLILIDPWDLVTANGSGPFEATIVKIGSDHATNKKTALLLRLMSPLVEKGVEYRYLVGSPRHSDREIEQVFSDPPVACSFIGISDDRATGANPFDLSWWRGGMGVLADISLA